jgi:predicted lipid-binding transport protein (Tim44 family)
MQNSFDITTLIFLGLAVFVIWRLRSVLGQKTGQEKDPFARREPPPSRPGAPDSGGDNIVRLPGASSERPAPSEVQTDRWKGIAEPGTPIANGLDQIVKVEPQFDAHEFLNGAKAAYEMIVTAFAEGHRSTLKDLLSPEVYEGFEAAITEREKRGESMESTFVSIDKTEIAGAEVRSDVAHVTLRFVSKLITVTRDAKGAIIDGSPDAVVDVTDMWTFARPLGSRDPNWYLVATEAGQ